MGQVAQYGMQGGQVSRLRHTAHRGGVALPWGGPTGGAGAASGGLPSGGNEYPQMAGLTKVGGTAQPEIWTFTFGGTGTAQFQFGANIIYTAPAVNVATCTAAQLLAALQNIWPTWALPAGAAVGSAGGPFTVTFGANARVGGTTAFAVTGAATATLTRSQRGSVGAGQYDLCDGVANTTIDAILIDRMGSGPTGDLPTAPHGPVSDTTFSPWAWIEGFFKAADIPNLTQAIEVASPKLSLYIGAAVTDAGAEVRLLQ